MGWIVIRNWDRHQHYGTRQPPWIKLYVQLVHDDDFQALTPSDRSALVGLWMIYAMTRRRVRDDTAVISRSIGQRVTKKTLERLNRAGFIDISASKPLALEVEEEKESPTPYSKPVDNSRESRSSVPAHRPFERQPELELLDMEAALRQARELAGR